MLYIEHVMIYLWNNRRFGVHLRWASTNDLIE